MIKNLKNPKSLHRQQPTARTTTTTMTKKNKGKDNFSEEKKQKNKTIENDILMAKTP